MFDYCRCKLSNSVAIRPDELINGVYHARSVAPSTRKGKPGFAMSTTSKTSYNKLKQGYAHTDRPAVTQKFLADHPGVAPKMVNKYATDGSAQLVQAKFVRNRDKHRK